MKNIIFYKKIKKIKIYKNRSFTKKLKKIKYIKMEEENSIDMTTFALNLEECGQPGNP